MMLVIKLPDVRKDSELVGSSVFKILYFILKKILPAASPDYDKKINRIIYWLIELDKDYYAIREIGFNEFDEPILFAPTNRNYGLWTDSDRVFNDNEFESTDPDYFNKLWNKLKSEAGESF